MLFLLWPARLIVITVIQFSVRILCIDRYCHKPVLKLFLSFKLYLSMYFIYIATKCLCGRSRMCVSERQHYSYPFCFAGLSTLKIWIS